MIITLNTGEEVKVNETIGQFTFKSNSGDIYDEAYVTENNRLIAYDHPTAQYVQLWHNFDEINGHWENKNTYAEF